MLFTFTLLLTITVGLGVGAGLTVGTAGPRGTFACADPITPGGLVTGTIGVLGKGAGLGIVLGTVPGAAALPPRDNTAAPVPTSARPARILIAVDAAVAVVATAVLDAARATLLAAIAAFRAANPAVTVL